jgi:hypothetical protein
MTENSNTTTESTSSQTENSENMIPQSRFNKVNEERKALAERLEALEKAQTERDESTRKQRETELAEQNQYKQLYEAAKAENESLKSLQGEVKRYRDAFESTLQTRLESIPEERRDLIPDLDPIAKLAWLDKAMPVLVAPVKPNAPRLDGGSGSAGSTGNPVGNLNTTQQQLIEMARQSGYSVDASRVAGFARNPTKQTDLDNKGDKP